MHSSPISCPPYVSACDLINLRSYLEISAIGYRLYSAIGRAPPQSTCRSLKVTLGRVLPSLRNSSLPKGTVDFEKTLRLWSGSENVFEGRWMVGAEHPYGNQVDEGKKERRKGK